MTPEGEIELERINRNERLRRLSLISARVAKDIAEIAANPQAPLSQQRRRLNMAQLELLQASAELRVEYRKI